MVYEICSLARLGKVNTLSCYDNLYNIYYLLSWIMKILLSLCMC